MAVDDDLIETDFGAWEGLTFAEAAERDPELHRRWLRDTSTEPPGGESFDHVNQRVRQARDRIVADHGGSTVLVVSHVTPIKMLLREALDAGPGILLPAAPGPGVVEHRRVLPRRRFVGAAGESDRVSELEIASIRVVGHRGVGSLACFRDWIGAARRVLGRRGHRRPATCDPRRGSGNPEDSGAIVTSWVRQPSWWAGTLGAVGGYVFQALALAHGSLLLVQPLLVSSLLFVLPLGARFSNQHVRARDWCWALVLTAALTVFVLVGQPREGHYRPPVPAWSVALVGSVPVVIVCVLAARRTVGRPRAMLLATAVAVLLGMIAVLTKVSTHRLAVHGWHGLLTVPAPYLLVALAVAVTVLQQSAFHAGALQASVPIMLVGEPVVAVLLGVVILGEHLVVRGAGALILALAVGAMTAATIALGRDSAPPATPVRSGGVVKDQARARSAHPSARRTGRGAPPRPTSREPIAPAGRGW